MRAEGYPLLVGYGLEDDVSGRSKSTRFWHTSWSRLLLCSVFSRRRGALYVCALLLSIVTSFRTRWSGRRPLLASADCGRGPAASSCQGVVGTSDARLTRLLLQQGHPAVCMGEAKGL